MKREELKTYLCENVEVIKELLEDNMICGYDEEDVDSPLYKNYEHFLQCNIGIIIDEIEENIIEDVLHGDGFANIDSNDKIVNEYIKGIEKEMQLVGKKWGDLDKETQEELLNHTNVCQDNDFFPSSPDDNGCIFDLTDRISVGGMIVESEEEVQYIVEDDKIIYAPRFV